MRLAYAQTGGNGNGSGAITSDPAGIACVYDGDSSSGDCIEEIPFGTAVTLTPAASSGSIFAGWSGSCSGDAACTVPISQTESVTATFMLVTHTLDVTLSGDGSGMVADDLNQLSCGGESCQATYDHNTLIVLIANPAVESTFDEWLGDCVGNGVCVLTIDQTRTVTATFEMAVFRLTVIKGSTGNGMVTSQPAGIDCGANCSADFDRETTVNLIATPDQGSTFDGWFGACSGIAECEVLVDQAHTVYARFGLIQQPSDPLQGVIPSPGSTIKALKPTFEWPASEFETGNEIISYTLQLNQVSPASGSSLSSTDDLVTYTFTSSTPSFTVPDELPLGRYEWTVIAHDSAGQEIKHPRWFSFEIFNGHTIFLPLILQE